MKEDDVRLDSQFAQLRDPFFEPAKKFGVEPGGVPFRRRRALVREDEWLIMIPLVVFREDAEPDLVERRRGQRPQRLLLQRVILVRPGVARGPDLLVRR